MRSDRIKKGVNAAPQRSLLYALGLTEEEINKPLIGIVELEERYSSGTHEYR
ncbi:MAG: hypothetical protein V8T08_06490 [Monoglobus pectinilyticus]